MSDDDCDLPDDFVGFVIEVGQGLAIGVFAACVGFLVLTLCGVAP